MAAQPETTAFFAETQSKLSCNSQYQSIYVRHCHNYKCSNDTIQFIKVHFRRLGFCKIMEILQKVQRICKNNVFYGKIVYCFLFQNVLYYVTVIEKSQFMKVYFHKLTFSHIIQSQSAVFISGIRLQHSLPCPQETLSGYSPQSPQDAFSHPHLPSPYGA